MGRHPLLKEIFLTQGFNPHLLHYRQILYHLSHRDSPRTSIVTSVTDQGTIHHSNQDYRWHNKNLKCDFLVQDPFCFSACLTYLPTVLAHKAQAEGLLASLRPSGWPLKGHLQFWASTHEWEDGCLSCKCTRRLNAVCKAMSPFMEQETAGSNLKCIMHCDCIGRGLRNVKVLLQ